MASNSSGGMLFKTGLFAALAAISYFVFNFFSGKQPIDSTKTSGKEPNIKSAPGGKPAKQRPDFEILPSDPAIYEPTSTTNDLVRHTWFSLSYSETHEQAEWVAYEVTRERLNANYAERSNTFRPDAAIKTESATPRDYAASGYDKGHLCPASDMGFDEKAMDESFFMSNISPQKRAFNAGIWRELEENVRDWGRKFGHVYVVTGPIFKDLVEEPIGFSKVTVPAYFYKIVLAGDNAIAFVLPNAQSDRPIMDFAVNIDQVEKITGIDFFPKLLTGSSEKIESRIDKSAWLVDDARFSKRVTDWNSK